MKNIKRPLGEFHNTYEMTTSVRFCLSYDHVKLDFKTFKMDNI